MYWECLCECGNKTIVSASYLRNGKIKSCGCLRKEGNNTKHQHTSRSHTPSPTYSSWIKAKQRCNNPNVPNWVDYGGRGIKVCDRWLDSFENFLADMGERPDGTTIDRINNDGNYEPGNCKWSTPKEQSNNRRDYKKRVKV